MPAKTMLLVEDDAKFSRLLVRAFARSGVETAVAADGDAALRRVRHGVSFHAVVLDIMIPHPDGIEVCRHLRRLAPEIPVIAMSARSGSEHSMRARAAGADVFVAKPFRLSDMVALTCDLMRQASARETP